MVSARLPTILYSLRKRSRRMRTPSMERAVPQLKKKVPSISAKETEAPKTAPFRRLVPCASAKIEIKKENKKMPPRIGLTGRAQSKKVPGESAPLRYENTVLKSTRS